MHSNKQRIIYFYVLFLLALTLLTHCSKEKDVQVSDPLLVPGLPELTQRMETEIKSTRPDYIVFVPQMVKTEISDTGNEHFLVFDGPDDTLMAVWTQSTHEGQPDQHIVFAQSNNEGKDWTTPRIIAGPAKAGQGHMASWAFPLTSQSGRIYVLYSQNVGKFDTFRHTTGRLDGIFSDDGGQSWSSPETISIPRSNRDNPDPSFPANLICWQKPLRLAKGGKYLAGVTRWTSNAVVANPTESWTSHDSRVEFMRFDNLDDDPPVSMLKISWFAANDEALEVPFPNQPQVSSCQEPSIVKLPDGRLFCVMRTAAGSPFWTLSSDDGETWLPPRRLLNKDGGSPIRHPLSPCPIYDVEGNTAGSGQYALFIHNHDGHYKDYGPLDTSYHRRPVFRVNGRFVPNSDQPVWFDDPELFMDHGGVSLGAPNRQGRLDLALYSSLTVRKGKTVLWYPDRKFFLLGRMLD